MWRLSVSIELSAALIRIRLRSHGMLQSKRRDEDLPGCVCVAAAYSSDRW